MSPIYTSDGITINGGKTPKGIEYMEYGNVGDPLIVYLHGVGERFASPSNLLLQSPVCAGWNKDLGSWGEMEGFKYPDFFKKGIRVVAPVLKAWNWSPSYIDNFLDEINTTNLTCLMGWSLGGGAVGVYLTQATKKYDFKCGVLLSKSGSESGVNVTCPVKLVHGTNDSKGCPVSNSDTFYAGVPSQYKAGYSKTAGDHWEWQGFLEPSTGIYEWILAQAEPPKSITYKEVKTEKGSDGKLYINDNGVRTPFN